MGQEVETRRGAGLDAFWAVGPRVAASLEVLLTLNGRIVGLMAVRGRGLEARDLGTKWARVDEPITTTEEEPRSSSQEKDSYLTFAYDCFGKKLRFGYDSGVKGSKTVKDKAGNKVPKAAKRDHNDRRLLMKSLKRTYFVDRRLI